MVLIYLTVSFQMADEISEKLVALQGLTHPSLGWNGTDIADVKTDSFNEPIWGPSQ